MGQHDLLIEFGPITQDNVEQVRASFLWNYESLVNVDPLDFGMLVPICTQSRYSCYNKTVHAYWQSQAPYNEIPAVPVLISHFQ
jgi:hypothetical protein